MTPRAGHFIVALAICTTVLLFWSCAQQGAPQGGPADTTAPTVDLTVPASGDVLVARDAALSLQFSEPMDKKTLVSNLSISPPRAGVPKFKWSNGGRHVTITWPDSLRVGTTYRITLNNRVADRRNNRLPEPFTFAFSTGAQLDRGEIRGRVYSEDKEAPTFDVHAYLLEAMPDTFWLAPPDYSTQTGPGGRFQLPFLRAGTYRLLALSDGDRDQRLDQGEQFALAPHDFTISDTTAPDSTDLFPQVRDTVPFTLRHCSAVGLNAVALAFSHPLDSSGAAEWQIEVVDSASRAPVDVSVLRPTPRRTSVITLLGQFAPGAVYDFSAALVLDQRGRLLDSGTCSHVYLAPTDVLGPKFELISLPTAAEALSSGQPITWIFSEPLDTARFNGAATVRDTAGVDLAGVWQWIDPQTLSFVPTSSWPDTIIVMAAIDSSRVADLAGNLASAGTFRWRFSPLGETQFGEVEGTIQSVRSEPTEFWLEARGVGSARKKRVLVSAPSQFSLSLPAGRWQLGGFVDVDDDGRWSPGSILPFHHPELRVIANDTLNIRARFTLEEVTLRY